MNEVVRESIPRFQFIRQHFGQIVVGVILIAIVYGGMTVLFPRLREQRIARRIESLGGFVNRVHFSPNPFSPTSIPQSGQRRSLFPQIVYRISMHNKEVPSDLFSDIELLPHLESLDLQDCIGVTDDSLVHLKGLVSLETLDIPGSQVTDVGLEHLKSLVSLRSLDISRTQVTVAGLEQLNGRSNLSTLVIDGPQVTDRALEIINRRAKLACLFACNGQLTETGLNHLKEMTRLLSLVLRNAQITDESLEHLKGITRLRVLVLRSNPLTDAGLEQLKGLTGLELVQLHDTQTTPEGRAKLRAALPNCTITPEP
jgi:Leucine-rich repeat (LRR) protein